MIKNTILLCTRFQSTTTCKGNENPAKCTSKYTGKCKDADLGDLVQSLCPVMCGTCPELTATKTAEDRARRFRKAKKGRGGGLKGAGAA